MWHNICNSGCHLPQREYCYFSSHNGHHYTIVNLDLTITHMPHWWYCEDKHSPQQHQLNYEGQHFSADLKWLCWKLARACLITRYFLYLENCNHVWTQKILSQNGVRNPHLQKGELTHWWGGVIEKIVWFWRERRLIALRVLPKLRGSTTSPLDSAIIFPSSSSSIFLLPTISSSLTIFCACSTL